MVTLLNVNVTLATIGNAFKVRLTVNQGVRLGTHLHRWCQLANVRALCTQRELTREEVTTYNTDLMLNSLFSVALINNLSIALIATCCFSRVALTSELVYKLVPVFVNINNFDLIVLECCWSSI